MASYYQIVKPVGNCQEIFHKTSELEMNPTTFNAKIKGYFIALNISPEHLNQFDQSIQDLNIQYLLFSNLDFIKLIENAKKLGMKIRDVMPIEIGKDLQEELDKYLKREDFHNLVNFVTENCITIKEVEFLFNNIVIRVYDCGIIWSDLNLSSSIKLTHLIESILDLVE